MDDNKLGWFLAGAVVGASVALLYAPKPGKETRKLIQKTTKQGRAAVESGSREIMDRGKELYDRGREIADEAADLFERGRRLVQG